MDISDLTIEDKDIIKSIFEVLQGLNKLREFHFEYNISDIDFDKVLKKEYGIIETVKKGSKKNS